jgi:hypothetical protein
MWRRIRLWMTSVMDQKPVGRLAHSQESADLEDSGNGRSGWRVLDPLIEPVPHTLAVLTNGSATLTTHLLAINDLSEQVERVVTVDQVGAWSTLFDSPDAEGELLAGITAALVALPR